ncbi:hypothetical protein AG1IA_07220 [Rhizoctonia solani AG-1 IA]|uniref:Uncharacterized protein n=1 Tax=Thanatephorus cucumeris (strain AG1-IA) TaxID=983506 RepID=L8WLE6_THACA|nr:hypothetical protein AG1IA_07220 [Rhizoctonia solani AG-1 IA]
MTGNVFSVLTRSTTSTLLQAYVCLIPYPIHYSLVSLPAQSSPTKETRYTRITHPPFSASSTGARGGNGITTRPSHVFHTRYSSQRTFCPQYGSSLPFCAPTKILLPHWSRLVLILRPRTGGQPLFSFRSRQGGRGMQFESRDERMCVGVCGGGEGGIARSSRKPWAALDRGAFARREVRQKKDICNTVSGRNQLVPSM